MTHVSEEIAGQPECWQRASTPVAEHHAVLREAAGRSETDTFAASEMPIDRSGDHMRVTVERAAARGLDPDRPRHLTRSAILSG
ncbi:hypothetical protein AB0I10_40730 [Streptomyces sp. NPDC050636]|uniref:hypothetical protein n=1 Tax=Streptomyces sp. NPDC050636 TaxID=3154510 RepID=UPI00342F7D7F